MTELRPWVGFDSLVDGLAQLRARAQKAAARSIDEILTLRNWLVGAWIVAYEQEGSDRARYGEGLIDALAAAFKARGVQGLSGRNLRNYRQIALAWPRLALRRMPSGEADGPARIWQTLSAESVPALPSGGEILLPWQDDAWMLRLRRELSFSHLLELSLADENPPVGLVLCADKDAEEVHYATGSLDHQVFVSRYLTRLPTEQQLLAWLAEERELLARRGESGRG